MTNVAVVGAGYWGPNLIRNLSDMPDATVRCVCDLSEERLSYIAQKYRIGYTTTDFQEVLADDEIEAVVIATPASTHYRLVRAALLAGKDVMVEKPLAKSVDEALELTRTAGRGGRVLMVGHTFLYNAAVRALKEYVAGGEVGDILYIHSQRLNLGRIRQDINALWNFAPHDISIVLYLLDERPTRVSAKGLSFIQDGIEDVVFLTMSFPSGIGVHIHVSWLDPQKVRLISVVGTQKMIVYDDVSPDAKIRIYDRGVTKVGINSSLGSFETFGEFQLLIRSGDIHIPTIKFTEPLRTQCEHFTQCVRNREEPLSGGNQGLRVIQVLEAAQASMSNDSVFQEVQWLEY